MLVTTKRTAMNPEQNDNSIPFGAHLDTEPATAPRHPGHLSARGAYDWQRLPGLS